MKKGNELRELMSTELVGARIAASMNGEAEIVASKGHAKTVFLCDKDYHPAAVDFAISEMVALGFKIDKVESESISFDHYQISW